MNGLSIMGVIISYCGIGLFFMYKSKKTGAKLLIYASIVGICFGLQYLGSFIDFVTILLTDNNMDNPNGLYSILNQIWLPPAMIFSIYLAAELLIPEKKWHIVSIYIVLGIIFELFILLDPMGSFTFVDPESPGEDLIDSQFTFGSPAGIIFIIFFLSFITFWGFGFLYKSIKSIGILRKKFLLLSIGSIYTLTFAIIDSLTSQGIIIFFARFCTFSGFLFFYFGLREEPAESKKLHPKKEVKVEGRLFRLARAKPTEITEEEVTFHKEQKICLVCKGKVEGYNVFICRSCDVLYCQNCAQALENLENMCWVCNEPINEAKPVELYKEEEEAVVTKEKTYEKGKKKI